MPPVRIDADALLRSLDGLRDLELEGELEDSLVRLVRATQAVFGISGAGFMLVDDEETLHYVAATGSEMQALEQAQRELGRGPCIDAFVLGRLVETTDVLSDERWPELGPLLEGTGVRAVLGIPTQLGGSPIGALNVFHSEPRGWDSSEFQAIEAFNTVLEGILASAVSLRKQSHLIAQLQYALDYRVIIERAIGLLMGREGLDAVAAFNRLRQEARRQRRRVADVARQLLADDSEASPEE